jgi:phosphomannomutase
VYKACKLSPSSTRRDIDWQQGGFMSLKVSVSGIRGVIGNTLDAESLVRWASAFGNWLPDGPVVLTRDSRPSGPMIESAVEAALRSTGHDVVRAGLLSTPASEYLVQQTDAVGGVIVTASHNPVEWNALKLLRDDGLFLDATQVDELRALHDAPARRHRGALDLGGVSEELGGEKLHRDAILAMKEIDVDAIAAKKIRVVVDAVEGAGGHAVPALLEALGAEVHRLHCGCTGMFPHDPEPTPKNLSELRQVVEELDADLGMAVDPDVDRLALVDRGGVSLSEELTLAVAADFVLERTKGPVVVNLSTTMALDRVAERHGVQIFRSPVGEANVVAEMFVRRAVIGGEGNGGVIYPSLHPGRDAPLGAALVLAAVVGRGSLRACLDRFPNAEMVKFKQELTAEIDRPELWREAAASLGPSGSWNESDGIRYDLGDRWVHLRRSNTENALRIIAEAPDAREAAAMIERVRATMGA